MIHPSDILAARILVVDDEVGTGYALKLLLELDGYEVLLAADGDEAWRLACAEPTVPSP